MKKKQILLTLLLLLGVALSAQLVAAQSPVPERDAPAPAQAIPGRYLLAVDPQAGAEARRALRAHLGRAGGSVLGDLALIDGWLVALPAGAAAELSARSGVATLQPDLRLERVGEAGLCREAAGCTLSALLSALETAPDPAVLNVRGPYLPLLERALARAAGERRLLAPAGADPCFSSPAASRHVLTVAAGDPTARLPACVDLLVFAADDARAVQAVAGADGTVTALAAQAVTCHSRLFVDRSATGSGDGSSWADAYTDLQTALAAITSCTGQQAEIWVAAGVYYPDEGTGQRDGDRTAAFLLPDNVAVYGGFAAGGSSLAARDWRQHQTVLSGDMGQDDGATAAGVVTDTTQIVGPNSFTVVDGSGATNALLDGFTITAGQAAGSGPYPSATRRGAGFYAAAMQGTLSHLYLVGNSAPGSGTAPGYGGSFYFFNGSDVTLLNVHVAGSSAGGSGGGIYASQSGLTLTNLLLAGNAAEYGGGLFSDASTARVTNATVVANRAASYGGGWRAIYTSEATIYNSIFQDNVAASGAAISLTLNSTATLDFNLLQGSCPAGVTCSNEISGDPAFTVPVTGTLAPTAQGDFHLDRYLSAAIDAGEDGYVLAGVTTDLDGNDRIEELDAYPEFNVDLGAYEFNLPELVVTAVVTGGGADLELSWMQETEACVWVIHREPTPYFAPTWDNYIGVTCDAAQCYGASYTVAGIVADDTAHDFLRVRPDECLNVFESNEIGVFHFPLVPGS